ncbi:MAG: hypothetical protein QXU18_00115 [Thermoplasmatales archaeon]
MKTLVFSYPHENCTNCHSRLKVYRKDRGTVKTENGTYIAEHKILIGTVEEIRFRASELDHMASKYS